MVGESSGSPTKKKVRGKKKDSKAESEEMAKIYSRAFLLQKRIVRFSTVCMVINNLYNQRPLSVVWKEKLKENIRVNPKEPEVAHVIPFLEKQDGH